MRHGKKFNHLGRKTAHRKAMLSNMACSLIEHKRINTTEAKAKALRKFVEPLITKSIFQLKTIKYYYFIFNKWMVVIMLIYKSWQNTQNGIMYY